jgi:hypothetical protein
MRARLADLLYQKPVSTSKRVNADVYQERQLLVLGVQRTYPDGKYAFQQI